MRDAQFTLILLLALVVSTTVLIPSMAPVFGMTVVSAAQDAVAVEAALGLDRPTRRLIQEGLRKHGFDPGTPDGLFGPQTRDAIRRWQGAQDAPATGYLGGEQVELLSASGALPPSGTESVEPPPARAETASAPPDSAPAASALLTDDGNPPVQADTHGGVIRPPTEATGNARQLPPEILVDRHLVRVERLIADQAYGAARDVIAEIEALQQEHDLALEEEFHFTYARMAFAAGLHETAISSVNEYLLAAGRDADFYRDALELLDSAEEALRLAEAERRRAEAARHRIEEARRREEARQRANSELARRQIELAATGIPRDELRSGGLGPEMVPIASGRFQYLTTQGDRRPRDHLLWVDVDAPFAISKYEVTRGEFERFADRNRYRTDAEDDGRCRHRDSSWKRPRSPFLHASEPPRIDQTDAHPVVCVSNRDALAYAEWVSRETGHSYRLPSPAEWQYAARAGSDAAMLHIDGVDGKHCGRANLDEDDEENCTDGVRYTAPVGAFAPNGVGVHDMIGNVAELVLGCGRLTGNYIILAGDGSPERIDGCDRPATMGGSYYHRGTPAKFTYYGTLDFLYIYSRDRTDRAGTSYAGIRLVRDLRD